jgi:hypothetical protein
MHDTAARLVEGVDVTFVTRPVRNKTEMIAVGLALYGR